jgi:miniconductance mechanosensitive channel
MMELLTSWVYKMPGIQGYEAVVITCIAMLALWLAATIAYLIAKVFLVRLITKLIFKTKSDLDDILIKHKVFARIAYLVPVIIIYALTPKVLNPLSTLSQLIVSIAAIYLVILVVMIINSVINSLLDIFNQFSVAQKVPIHSFGQVAKLVTYFLAAIVIVSLVIGQSPLKLFAGLGAMTAVLMLVFKEPILGFVAGVHLSYNRMVSIGDWVDIPQHNASGDILEIGLTTVKVKNFDNTITTVPTQSLINDSFKNWRGMQESGGRRIKRAIYLDINSIKFCDTDDISRYRKIDYIKEYLEEKKVELDGYNQQSGNVQESLANGRRLTNVGTFRAYVLAYLKHHPLINQDLTILARQLSPSDGGLPIEVYAFSADKNWANYESLQADIFDHLLAVVSEFDLRVFQKPSGVDMQRLLN